MKVKLSIKNRWTGSIIFEYEKENNTIKETVAEYIKHELSKGKYYAYLTGAYLTGANLTGADLTGADLNVFKNDLWSKLLIQKEEAAGLLEKIKSGEIDGSCYEGSCCCFVGTIANIKKKFYENISVKPDSSSPVERWFFQFRPGDTPDKKKYAKITVEWIEEFLIHLNR